MSNDTLPEWTPDQPLTGCDPRSGERVCQPSPHFLGNTNMLVKGDGIPEPSSSPDERIAALEVEVEQLREHGTAVEAEVSRLTDQVARLMTQLKSLKKKDKDVPPAAYVQTTPDTE